MSKKFFYCTTSFRLITFLVILSFSIYSHTLTAGFLTWDDRENILLNPWIEHFSLAKIWAFPYYNMYIPVTYSLWALMWQVTHEPWLFHLANVLIHSANAVLVYLIAIELLIKEKKAALFVSLIFACHPIQVETVAWISAFRDLLSTFFMLSAVYLMILRNSYLWYTTATGLFCLSLLSKPSVAIIPAAMIFVLFGLNQLTRRKVLQYLFWFVPALAVSYLTSELQSEDLNVRVSPLALMDRLVVAIDTVTFYLQKFFLPYPLQSDYGRIPEVALNDHLWMIGLGITCSLVLLAYMYRKYIPVRTFYFAGLFVLLLAPVLGIIPFQAQGTSTISDRYAYVSLIALGLLFGPLFARSKLWPIGTVIIAAFSVTSIIRAEVWQNNEVFFRDMLDKNEKSYAALSSLGIEYIRTQQLSEAQYYLERAIKLNPMGLAARANMTKVYLLQSRPQLVLTELAPLLQDQEFMRVNRNATRSIAAAHRLIARAHRSLNDWTHANESYCKWHEYEQSNEAGNLEYQTFFQDAQAQGIKLLNCLNR